jgi:predicted Zn-dependent protease
MNGYSRTYLKHCLRNGLTVRWPDSAMPINVYVAPFQWYEKSKQMVSHAYHQMVLDAMSTWSRITGEAVRFRLVSTVQESQIDLKWRRVDRRSLGHCEFLVNDRSMIYSAEIQIGISDGLLHARYNDIDEVKHTILHEFGHALGLVGHSDGPGDIMYVPHQFGVVNLSQRDIETLQWLYKLPVAFDYLAIGKKYELPEPFTMDDVIEQIAGNPLPKEPFRPPAPKPRPEQPEVLNEQHQILTEMGKFYLNTQNIQLKPELRDMFIQKQWKPPGGRP